MEETHIQIRTENQSGNFCPTLYNGRFNDTDFINRDVIAGELVLHMLERFYEFNITEENIIRSLDEGRRIVIELWKDQHPHQLNKIE